MQLLSAVASSLKSVVFVTSPAFSQQFDELLKRAFIDLWATRWRVFGAERRKR